MLYLKHLKKTVAFLTLGCKVNTYETNAMELLFEKAGYNQVPFSQNADIYIINTCSVTNMADRKSRQMLHKARKTNPNAIVVAVGCYVQASQDLLEKDSSVDLLVGNSQKHLVVEIVEQYQKDCKKNSAIVDLTKEPDYEILHIENAGEHTRAFIKIQDGCNQFCSYCIIPYTRGRVRSREEKDIIQEVKKLVENGYKEFVLNGIHLSSYGANEQNKDFMALEGKPLLNIVEKINAIPGVERIRLGSLEPRVITETFTKELVKNEKLCPHFHLSLQSGCNSTLKRMNRKYTTDEFKESCDILRKYYKNPAITTDIIVGFPGETNTEFSETIKFLEEIRFSQMHIFKFSSRTGTRAAKMEAQIDEQTKTQRSALLQDLDSKLQLAYQDTFINQKQYVLFEEIVTINEKHYLLGHNERYIKIAVPVPTNNEQYLNRIVPVVIENRLTTDIMIGKIS